MLMVKNLKKTLSVAMAAILVLQLPIMAHAEETTSTLTTAEAQLAELSAQTGISYKDHFYDAANATAFATHEIAPTDSAWSWWDELSNGQIAQREKIFSELLSKDNYAEGTPEQKLTSLYEMFSDTEFRNEHGLGEFQPYLDGIINAADLTEYITAVMKLSLETGYSSILPTFDVMQDDFDASRYVVAVSAGDTLLGRDYYETPDYKPYIELYNEYLYQLLLINGFSEKDAQRMAKNTDFIGRKLALVELSTSDWYDIEKYYNVYSEADLAATFKGIDFESFIKAAGYDGQAMYLVPEEEKFQMCSSLITGKNLQALKDYSATVLVKNLASCTTQYAYDLTVELNNTLSGITEKRSNEYYWMSQVESVLGWNYGYLYTKKYGSKEANAEVTRMIYDILDQYREIINSQEWMSAETKLNALSKLDTLQISVGYPADFTPYLARESAIADKDQGGCLTASMIRIKQEEDAYNRSLLGTPVDRTKWEMVPQTINAYYSPNNNSITILEGIMQKPFYDPDASYEANLGAIGMVIGHEISHGFDSNGSQYDAYGNFNPWWSEEEMNTYHDMCQSIIDYYDVYPSVETGLTVNGALTLTENIADLGGLYVITQIIGHDKEALQEMFLSYANLWAEKMTYEYAYLLLLIDVHSPGRTRVDAVVSSTDAFYEAFDIQEGDGMYVAPEDRVGIWK